MALRFALDPRWDAVFIDDAEKNAAVNEMTWRLAEWRARQEVEARLAPREANESQSEGVA